MCVLIKGVFDIRISAKAVSWNPNQGEKINAFPRPIIFSETPLQMTHLKIQWKARILKTCQISADADGGPRSRVLTAGHSAQPPIDVSGNLSAHVSA